MDNKESHTFVDLVLGKTEVYVDFCKNKTLQVCVIITFFFYVLAQFFEKILIFFYFSL